MRHALPIACAVCIATLTACTDRTEESAQGTQPIRDQAGAPPSAAPAQGVPQGAAGVQDPSALSDGTRQSSGRVPIGDAQRGDASASAVVRSSAGPQMHLLDAAGASVYLLEGNTDGTQCDAACEKAWPPVLATASRAEAGTGVDAQLLGMTPRRDRSYQVSYGNNPLYRYAGDAGAGRTNGHGVRDQWGQWSLVGLDGKPVTNPLPN